MHHQEQSSRSTLLIKWSFLCGILLAGLIFTNHICQCRLESPEPTLEVVDCRGQYICEVRDGGPDSEAGYWDLKTIPPRVQATVQAVEDHRFYMHPGVDPVAIFRAIRQNIGTGSRVSGASTIAMQVARLQRPADRNYFNKTREMLDAICLTARYGRSRIMAQYLKLAPYGNGIRGLAYASRYYFHKPVEDLSWAEIAFLCAIPQQPNRMNPRTPAGRVRVVARARRILKTVAQRGMLTDHEYQRAEDQVASLMIGPRRKTSVDSIHLALRYRDLFDGSSARRSKLDSPIVRTGIDLELQTFISEQTKLCVDAWKVAGTENGAVMVIDAQSMDIVALVGSSDYFDSDNAGAIDYTDIMRSPGSTLKPFIYALALDNGVVSPEGYLDDDVQRASGFQNFDRVWMGRISVGNALGSSRNIPAVNLLRNTGLYRTYGCFADLQLHDHEVGCERYGLGMAIGGLPVTMEMLARAYSVFINGGRLGDLIWFKDHEKVRGRKIFSDDTVQWIGHYLANPLTRLPSFPRLGNLEYDYPVAVKTGTSEGCRDSWTVAWSSRYLTLVWLGRPDGQPMNGVGGYNAAAELAHVVMDRLHEQVDVDPFLPVANGRDLVEKPVPNDPLATDQLPTNQVAQFINSNPGFIRITSPEDGSIYYFDPEMPQSLSTILLAADVQNPANQTVTWTIDHQPYRTVSGSKTLYWPMVSGKHTISLKSSASPENRDQVTISVRVLE